MFYIQSKVEYGLNFLVILAKNGSQAPLSLKKIAETTHMPYRFLTQVVKPLIKADLVQAKEGKGGGYTLIQPPASIKLKAVLEALGEPMAIAKCLGNNLCATSKGCKMKKFWQRIKDSIDRDLNKLTLKDLI